MSLQGESAPLCLSGGVLLVAEGNRSGGIGRYCVDLAEALGRMALLVSLCPEHGDRCQDCWLRSQAASRNIGLVAVPMEAGQWRQGCAGFTSLWLESGRPLVHANGRRGNLVAQVLARRFDDFAFVTSAHGVLGLHYRRNVAYRALEMLAWRRACSVIAVSVDTRRRLIAMGTRAETTACIPNGLSNTDIANLAATAQARTLRRAQASDGQCSLTVGLVARLSPEKGVRDFMEAANAANAQGLAVRFLVAGDGPLMDMVVSNPLHGSGVMRHLGEVGDVSEVLGDIDVLLMPSTNEGLPYALLEAMAAGCAPVAYAVGGIPEVIDDKSKGILVSPGDVSGLVRAVTMLASRPGLVSEIGRNAAEHIATRFRLESRLPALLGAYEKAGCRSAGPPALSCIPQHLVKCA